LGLVPHLFVSFFGVTLEPAGVEFSNVDRSIAWVLMIAYLVALVVSVLRQLAGALNVLGWMPVAIQTFYVAGFGY
jgi:hypothetical protein